MYCCTWQIKKLVLPEVYEDKWDRERGPACHFQPGGYCRSSHSCDKHSVLFRTCDRSRVSLPEEVISSTSWNIRNIARYSRYPLRTSSKLVNIWPRIKLNCCSLQDILNSVTQLGGESKEKINCFQDQGLGI